MTGSRGSKGFWLVVVGLALSFLGGAVQAQTGYTAPDESYRFDYPQRWKVEPKGDKLLLTAPDGSHFTLENDALASLPSESPVNDAGLKEEAAKRVAPLLKNAVFVRAQSLTMDHGQGASFRFKSGKAGDDTTADVWIGIIGKHSVVLLPEKAGQPNQTIGLSILFQSYIFADALPKPPVRPNNPAQPGNRNTPNAGDGSVVSYTRQIAPILQNRCRSCHNSNGSSGGLDVTSYAAFLRGGASGACILPGKPAASTLLDYLTGKRDQMPRGSQPLSTAQVALFRQWIAGGAKDDSAGDVSSPEMSDSKGQPGQKGAARPRAGTARPPRNTAPTRGPALMEGYSGHLVSNDLSFKLRLMHDGTATAVWTFSAQSEAQFTGTYTGHDGNYVITLTLASGTLPYTLKTLTLNLRSVGSQEVGQFGMDTNPPTRPITRLELSELAGGFNRQPGNAASGRPGRKKK